MVLAFLFMFLLLTFSKELIKGELWKIVYFKRPKLVIARSVSDVPAR